MRPVNADRLKAFAAELVDLHDGLRADLARLRAGKPPAGDLPAGDLPAGGPPAGDLRAHCLTFCAALTRHHTDEDRDVFPALADRYPDLRPIVDKLVEDHRLIAGIVARIEATDDPRELDGLAAIMESHFAFEERRVLAALRA